MKVPAPVRIRNVYLLSTLLDITPSPKVIRIKMRMRYAVNCQKYGMFALLAPFTQPMRRDKTVTTFLPERGVLVGTSKSPVVVDVTSELQRNNENLSHMGYRLVLESKLSEGTISLTHEIGDAETPFFRDSIRENFLKVYRNPTYTHFLVSFSTSFGNYPTAQQTVVTPSVSAWLDDDSSYTHPEGSPESSFLRDLVSKTTF